MTKGPGGVSITKIKPIYEPSVTQKSHVVTISGLVRRHVVDLVAAVDGDGGEEGEKEGEKEGEEGEEDMQVFLSQVRTTQMYSSFSEESQHR